MAVIAGEHGVQLTKSHFIGGPGCLAGPVLDVGWDLKSSLATLELPGIVARPHPPEMCSEVARHLSHHISRPATSRSDKSVRGREFMICILYLIYESLELFECQERSLHDAIKTRFEDFNDLPFPPVLVVLRQHVVPSERIASMSLKKAFRGYNR